MRTIIPSAAGFSPRPESRMAFSTAETIDLSHTWTVSIRGSGAPIVPTWFSGMLWP